MRSENKPQLKWFVRPRGIHFWHSFYWRWTKLWISQMRINIIWSHSLINCGIKTWNTQDLIDMFWSSTAFHTLQKQFTFFLRQPHAANLSLWGLRTEGANEKGLAYSAMSVLTHMLRRHRKLEVRGNDCATYKIMIDCKALYTSNKIVPSHVMRQWIEQQVFRMLSNANSCLDILCIWAIHTETTG